MTSFADRLFVGITCTSIGRKKDHWREQLKEINRYNIEEVALFPTTLQIKQREILYRELDKSCIKEIKLVHLRGQDFTAEEIEFFYDRYNTRLFNCHEKEFDTLYAKFPQFRKHIILEPNYDDRIENKLLPSRMGGFCIDLAHLKAAKDRHSVEYDYVLQHLGDTRFPANHLNGYSKRRKTDLHFVTNKNQFDYLRDLPPQVFSQVIGLELENSIKKQLEYREYIGWLMTKYKN